MALLNRPLPGPDGTSQSPYEDEEIGGVAGQPSSSNTNRLLDENVLGSKATWSANHLYSNGPRRNMLIGYVDLCFPVIIWVYHLVSGCSIY